MLPVALWLASAFTAVVGFLTSYFARRVAIAVTMVAALAAAFGVFYTVVSTVVSALAVSMPSEVVDYAGCFIPSNATACIAAIISVNIARWVYDEHMAIVRAQSQIL